MKEKLESLLVQAVESLIRQGVGAADAVPPVHLERTKDSQHGDFASNLALVWAKTAKLPPRDLAQRIIGALPEDGALARVEIAGPGFINFFVEQSAQNQIVAHIHEQGFEFGLSQIGAGRKIQIEFVSANPTGPLHVGHGRGAAYGSVLADLLEAVGFAVHREYYVNDAGRQMDILAVSVWLRYLEECGETITFPANGYRGEYVRMIARALLKDAGNALHQPARSVLQGLPVDEALGGDKELYIDALVARAKQLLGETSFATVFQAGLQAILADIKDDLVEFGVSFQEWFSERALLDTGCVQDVLARLEAGGYLYQQDGATWFASTRFGDEKDRVVIRENGLLTYFASDIAYHANKLERGFTQVINIWGADHHGYVPRIKAALTALGYDEKKLTVLLVQFAVLYRGTEKVQMSTRSGEFVTLRQLRNEVGSDAARFFYVSRRSDQHMDFDLKLATARSNDNPVYYVQYAHARICSVFRQLDEKGLAWDIDAGMQHLNLLAEPHETALLTTLSKYPEVLEKAALNYEPHALINYLRDLATDFHGLYNALPFLVEESETRNVRLNLIDAARQVLANGLGLLKINAPEVM
ncbi:MAG: arginine--tRNA ligase [Methylococcales bacterium]|nr:arginine--tRNA ligase [Methylococcales bacterium]